MLVFLCRQVFNINFQINQFITSLLRYEMQNGHTLVHEHDILTLKKQSYYQMKAVS